MLLTFDNHPPSSPKTTCQIKRDFLTHVNKTWLIKKPRENDDTTLSSRVSENFTLFLAISRFTERLLRRLDSYRYELEDAKDENNLLWLSTTTHYRFLADETALVHAQMIEVKNLFGLDIDVGKMVKQIYFEVAARYQATFECDVLAAKIAINPEKSEMWRSRMMQEELAKKTVLTASL